MLWHKGESKRFIPPLTIFESCIRKAIIAGEENALLKDSIVEPRKLIRAWDTFWWPAVAKYQIPIEEAKKKTIDATAKFVDYCKYDFSDYLWPTVGTNIESNIYIGSSTLKASADIIKVNLESSKPNTVIVNLNRKRISNREASFDAEIRAICYAFYSGKGETITHICLDLDEKNKKIKPIMSTFDHNDMEQTRKMLYHIESGIRKNVLYMNSPACKECNVCPEFKS